MTKKNKKDISQTEFIKHPSNNKKKLGNDDILKDNYPIFCFKYLSDKSIKKCKDSDVFLRFLMRLKELSDAGWDTIRNSNKHGYGMSPIPLHEIKPDLPKGVTPDIDKLHIFRGNGNNLPFLGIQIQNIFRVIFIETKFGDIYDHD